VKKICYGVQIQITGGGWAWVTPAAGLTNRPPLAASWAAEEDAASARDYLAESRPSQSFRVTKMFAVPRG
jgi:hypothetical protein